MSKSFAALFVALLAATLDGGGLAAAAQQPGLSGVWVRPVPTQASRREGLVFDPDGAFGLIGIHTMDGLSWFVDGKALVLTHNTDRYPEPQEARMRADLSKPGVLELSGKALEYFAGVWQRDDAVAGAIRGSVSYRQRIALPPNAAVHLELRGGGASDGFVASQTIPTQGRQIPLPFRLHFDRDDVRADRVYALEAKIVADGQILFETHDPLPVTPGGAGEIALMLEPHPTDPAAGAARGALRVPASFVGARPCASKKCPERRVRLSLLSDGSFRQREVRPVEGAAWVEVEHDLGRWSLSDQGRLLVLLGEAEPRRLAVLEGAMLEELDTTGEPLSNGAALRLQRADQLDPIPEPMRLHGMYRYLADAGLFTECRVGRRVPVAQEGDNAELERAYLEASTEPGRPMLVTLQGRFAERPRIDGPGETETLVPDAFINVWPGESCWPGDDPMLTTTRWRLLALNGRPLRMPEGREPPNLSLDAATRQVRGFAGCNHYFGSFRLQGEQLGFGSIGVSRRACIDTDELELAFLAALGKVDGYVLNGRTLELYGSGLLLARFGAG